MLNVLFFLFLSSMLSPVVIQLFKTRGAYALTLIPLLCFAYFVGVAEQISNYAPLLQSISWFDELGISLSFYLDGLSLLFANLITGIGVIIVFYSVRYFKIHAFRHRFYAYLFLFMGAMLGLVLADNLITLFVFWELTSISSFLLIGFDYERSAARKAALKSLLVTSAGGLALLIGFLLIGSISQTFELSQLLQQPDVLRQHQGYTAVLLLIIVGAFTKSAQFPFHFWLPAAMEAPTPVSAYLHSATMVQAGIYILARFHPLLSGTPLWFGLLTAFGGITMIGGVLLALRENDIKLILAYTTVSALGSLVYMLASDQAAAIKACVSFILVHALYKATLFLAAGNLMQQTGTRKLSKMSGLRTAMPVTFVMILIAASTMGGLPPLLGFYVKELIYEARQVTVFSQLFTMMVVLTNMAFVMLAFLFIIKPFLGKQRPKKLNEPYFSMWFSGLILALVTLFLGLFPFVIDRPLLAPAASAILHHPIEFRLTLWHGFTPSILYSVLTFLGGIILYLQRFRVKHIINYFKFAIYHGPELAYQRSLDFILWFANVQTRCLQNGHLVIYLMVTLSTVVLVTGIALLQTPLAIDTTPVEYTWFSVFLLFWLLISASAVLMARQLSVAVIFLGAFGLGVALFFLVNAAPDVAMTQVLVETMFVIIFVLTCYRIPELPSLNHKKEKKGFVILKSCIAISVGIIMSVLLYDIISQPMNNRLGHYFITHSLPLGHGHNIVNVILVDFRAFDTMGEVIVLVIAALGIYGLVKRKKRQAWL